MAEIITELSQLNKDGVYSYADYLLWRLRERIELIKGKIFLMSPAPSVEHQRIFGRIFVPLFNFAAGKCCEVFAAPFDVRLLDKTKSEQANHDIYSVVQPDISVICDPQKIDTQGCIGSPDLVVEILSKGNSKKEMKIKYALYEENGVKEYWVVYPFEHLLQQFVLGANDKYELKGSFAEDEIFQAHIFPDLEIDLGKIFDKEV
jgi:Uma2 family endonuclease